METIQGLNELIKNRLIEKKGNVKLTENTDIILYGRALGFNENQLLFKVIEIEETIDWVNEKENILNTDTFTAPNKAPSINNVIYCSNCNASNENGVANYCIDCGGDLKQVNYQENNNSNTNIPPKNNNNKSTKYLYYILGISMLVIAVFIGISLDFSKQNNNLETPPKTLDSIAINSRNTLNGNYTIASEKILTVDDLLNRNKYELKIMRNEIFARHGYIFKTNDMRLYFESQAWYSPRYDDVNSFLTEIEKGNIELIKRYE
jgi:hypothetical protein